MRYIIFSFLLFASSIGICQTKSTELKVSYMVYCNTDVPLFFEADLWVKNNVSIYQEKYRTIERWSEKPSEVTISSENLKRDYEPYLTINKATKEIFFYTLLGSKMVLVQDDYKEMDWKITNENKDASGYSCTKATTTYRGRNWIVWFTTDIPIRFGPWKLHGLPGLILEAYDESKTYSFYATSVESTGTTLFNKNFDSLMKLSSNRPITIKRYIEEKEEADANTQKIIENIPNIDSAGTISYPRAGEELKYEWEN